MKYSLFHTDKHNLLLIFTYEYHVFDTILHKMAYLLTLIYTMSQVVANMTVLKHIYSTDNFHTDFLETHIIGS